MSLIIEYHRPDQLEKAISLLERSAPQTIPLGGGGSISRMQGEAVAVVDLQNLRLDGLAQQGSSYSLGATAKLETLQRWQECPEGLSQAINRQFTLNLRNTATLAGSLVTADGKSLVAAWLLAVDCRLIWEPGHCEIPLGDWLALRRKTSGSLITGIEFSLPEKVVFEIVTKTPMDKPIAGVVLAQWRSGRDRVVLLGSGASPICVFDGTEKDGVLNALINACSHYFNAIDNSTYYSIVIETLIQRLIKD